MWPTIIWIKKFVRKKKWQIHVYVSNLSPPCLTHRQQKSHITHYTIFHKKWKLCCGNTAWTYDVCLLHSQFSFIPFIHVGRVLERKQTAEAEQQSEFGVVRRSVGLSVWWTSGYIFANRRYAHRASSLNCYFMYVCNHCARRSHSNNANTTSSIF